MTLSRIGLVLTAALAACSLGAGYGSSANPWVLTDVGKFAAHAYPDFEYVSFVGTTSDGRIYWLSGPKDGRGVRDLFRYQNGTISDLGTVPFVSAIVNDNGVLGGDDDFAPYGAGGKPPTSLFLWQNGVVSTLGTFFYAALAGLNDRGQVAELLQFADKPNELHAGLWQDGKTTDLGSLGGRWSWPAALNNRGQVVGGSKPANGRVHAFLWQRGKMTDIGTLRGDTSEAIALNDRGQVVGWWGRWGVGHPRAFLWQNGKATDLGRMSDDVNSLAINDRGQVIGSRTGALGANVGVLWQQGKTINLGDLGGGQTWPLALNDRGEIVGTSTMPGSTLTSLKLRAFLWENGRMSALPGTVNDKTSAMSIDPAGTHIVAASSIYRFAQILLWTRG